MACLLAMSLEVDSDDVLVFEVEGSEVPGGLDLASPRPGDIADRARVTLEEALAKLRPSLLKVVTLLQDMAPDETFLEFGLKIGGETGVIVAKGTAEANFAVRLTWKRT